LEPYLSDYRKLKVRGQAGWRIECMDEFVDGLLTKERVCDIALPRIPSRAQLEDLEELEPREGVLGSEGEDSESEAED
jgi:pre-mRNA-splicing factor 38A